MKNTINKKKLFLGIFTALLAIIAITIVMTATDEITLPETLEIQAELETLIKNFEVAPPVITASPPSTASPTTTPAPAEITPIIVEEPIAKEISIQEEPIIEIIENPPITQPASPSPPQEASTPPPAEMPEGAQWAENGQYYKIEDEQKYIWDNVLGWGRDNGRGTATIMDAQTSGYRFFVEPCGTVNLSKLIAPDGSIISYEEYQKHMGKTPMIIVETALPAENQSDPISVSIEIDSRTFTWEEYVEIIESR